MRRKDRRGGRSKVRGHEDVELNVAAMLDMAFQLLAFFILTFKPSPIESQIMMRLPDKAVTQAPSNIVNVTDVVDEGLAVSISIYSTPEGEIAKLVLGDNVLSQPTVEELMAEFRKELATVVGLGSETVNIRVGEDLRYERLMMVVDICGKQELPDGRGRLSKVSIVPLNAN